MHMNACIYVVIGGKGGLGEIVDGERVDGEREYRKGCREILRQGC